MAATKIEAIVLSSTDFEDDAKIVTVFSKQLGKVAFYAPGVNKIVSKNKYSVQTFSLSELEIFKSKNPDRLSKLKTGNLILYPENMAKNYSEYVYASICVKVLDLTFENLNKNYKAYSMIKKAIYNLENRQNSLQTYVLFLAYNLKFTGSWFDTTKCCICNKKNAPFRRFDYKELGMICSNCIKEDQNIQPISFVNLMVMLNKNSFLEMVGMQFNIVDLIALHIFLIDYYQYNLGYSVSAFDLVQNGASSKIPSIYRDSYI